MRHWSVQVGAILIGVLCATRSLAADAADCTDCSVANAIASALQEDDRSRSGVRIGDGDWLFSVTTRDLETYWLADWRLQFGVAIGFAEQLISNPGMDAARDSSWTIGLRFEFSR